MGMLLICAQGDGEIMKISQQSVSYLHVISCVFVWVTQALFGHLLVFVCKHNRLIADFFFVQKKLKSNHTRNNSGFNGQ